eukprot:CAMPEP_0174260226 /NCGR_PEP_ID=MMETSP0439-20130205/9305_1 /TAXON_ID=0 /ORGANISM="Stereomyxa ramosa, Strain Chinc5" /LENGTH=305 /DNA_ID=CAMNT_0015344425 /DNA_START=31 /DNA_END=948 /DNA_ORIENTATION=-
MGSASLLIALLSTLVILSVQGRAEKSKIHRLARELDETIYDKVPEFADELRECHNGVVELYEEATRVFGLEKQTSAFGLRDRVQAKDDVEGKMKKKLEKLEGMPSKKEVWKRIRGEEKDQVPEAEDAEVPTQRDQEGTLEEVAEGVEVPAQHDQEGTLEEAAEGVEVPAQLDQEAALEEVAVGVEVPTGEEEASVEGAAVDVEVREEAPLPSEPLVEVVALRPAEGAEKKEKEGGEEAVDLVEFVPDFVARVKERATQLKDLASRIKKPRAVAGQIKTMKKLCEKLISTAQGKVKAHKRRYRDEL